MRRYIEVSERRRRPETVPNVDERNI